VIEQTNTLASSRLVPTGLRRRPPPLFRHFHFEEQSIKDNDIDLAWFLSPSARPVSVPYIATVWDLEHRKQPYFPEVSTTGWTWEQRERNYQTLLPRAARIITGTQAGKNEIVSFYQSSPENVRVVRFPVSDDYQEVRDANRVVVMAKYGISNPFVIYPAQFWPHKITSISFWPSD